MAPSPAERDLKQTLRTWQARLQTLEAKVRALKHCKAKGETSCWAGDVRTLRAARKARDESRWVTERLGRALDWCRLQPVKKGGYGLVTLSKTYVALSACSRPFLSPRVATATAAD